MAVLALAIVLLASASHPTATLGPTSNPWMFPSVPPVVLLRSALEPRAVLPLTVLLVSAKASTPVLSSPVELLTSHAVPLAVLLVPAVFSKSAAAPVAVLSSPVLSTSVAAPTPVLKLPVVTLRSESQPTAVLAAPVVSCKRAFCPSAVVKFGYPPSGGGVTARAIG